MEDADGFDWNPRTCAECHAEVDVQLEATDDGLDIDYVCPVHGVSVETGPLA